jgi:hypothetical protein
LKVITDWPKESAPLLRELLAAIETPGVQVTEISRLIYLAQHIAASGPPDFARIIQPHLLGWAAEAPSGEMLSRERTGPFAMMQIGRVEGGTITAALGWLTFQLIRKLGKDASEEGARWVHSALLTGDIAPMGIAFYASVVLAAQVELAATLPHQLAAEAVMLSLRVRMNDSPVAARTLALALGYLAGIVAEPTFDLIDWRSPSGTVALKWLLGLLEEHGPGLGTAPQADVRSGLAEALWSIGRWNSLSSTLRGVLESLARDNRARVRFAASGGWRGVHAARFGS